MSVFEVAPLVRRLRELLDRARPLRPSDVALGADAAGEADARVTVRRSRVAAVRDDLAALAADMDDAVMTAGALSDAAVLAGIDGLVEDDAGLLARAAAFGIPETGWGYALSWRAGEYAGLVAALRERADRWDGRLASFAGLIDEYDVLDIATSDEERIVLLRRAESFVSTSPIASPVTPVALRGALPGVRDALVARRPPCATWPTATTRRSRSCSPTCARSPRPHPSTRSRSPSTSARPPSSPTPGAHRLARGDGCRGRAPGRGGRRRARGARRRGRGPAARRGAGGGRPGDARRRVPARPGDRAGPRAGRGARARARRLGVRRADALPDRRGGGGPPRRRVALRRRARPRAARRVGGGRHARRGLRASRAELVPLQLPYVPDDDWLALRFPDDRAVEGDHLLYTAHFARPLQAGEAHCALLLDEWTEVIPGDEAVTGIAMHYDRPNAEAPGMTSVHSSSRSAQWASPACRGRANGISRAWSPSTARSSGNRRASQSSSGT